MYQVVQKKFNLGLVICNCSISLVSIVLCTMFSFAVLVPVLHLASLRFDVRILNILIVLFQTFYFFIINLK